MTGERLSCEYLSDTLTVLCDGNVTCGLDDPNGTRSFGNIKLSSVNAIWRDLRYAERKQRLAEGRSCDGCSLHHVVEGAMPERVSAPRRLIVEATVVCNIRCQNDACFKNNDPSEQTRASRFLPLDVFKSLLDQTASGVEFMWFLNYGEPFLHPQAEDMIAYAKQKNPGMRVVSSTNGIPEAWLVLHRLSPLNRGIGNEDPDFDALFNLSEYLYGTDPWVSERFSTWVSIPGAFSGIP